MKKSNIVIAVLLSLLMIISLVFISCEKEETKLENDENVQSENEPENLTETETQPEDITSETDGETEENIEDKYAEEFPESIINKASLPSLPEEVHTNVFKYATYVLENGGEYGGGTLTEWKQLSFRCPDGITCFSYSGDGNSPGWGLHLYKIAANDDFAENGYYTEQNTVDGRFVGFGDVKSIKTYQFGEYDQLYGVMADEYKILEERIDYFEGGVGYNFYVRVDGEYIVVLSVAEANENDIDLYRATLASFVFDDYT